MTSHLLSSFLAALLVGPAPTRLDDFNAVSVGDRSVLFREPNGSPLPVPWFSKRRP